MLHVTCNTRYKQRWEPHASGSEQFGRSHRKSILIGKRETGGEVIECDRLCENKLASNLASIIKAVKAVNYIGSKPAYIEHS